MEETNLYISISFYIIGIGVFNSFIFFLMNKWNIIDKYQYYRAKWMPSCNMCLFFWMGVIMVLLCRMVVTPITLFVYASCCAVITRKMST